MHIANVQGGIQNEEVNGAHVFGAARCGYGVCGWTG